MPYENHMEPTYVILSVKEASDDSKRVKAATAKAFLSYINFLPRGGVAAPGQDQ